VSNTREPRAELAAMRQQIEHVDGELIELIAERVRLAREVGRLKRAAAQPLLDPAREAAVVRRAAELAAERGVSGEPVRAIFWQLIGLCRSAQHAGGNGE
jgi:chorismate mutase